MNIMTPEDRSPKSNMSNSFGVATVVKTKFSNFEIDEGEQLEISDFFYIPDKGCFELNFFGKDCAYNFSNLEDNFEYIGVNVDTINTILDTFEDRY